MNILTDDIDSILGNQSKQTSYIDEIDSILNEPTPQFEDDIVSDIENTLQIKPMDFTDKVSFAVETGLNIPNNIVNSIAKAIRGSDKTAEDTVLDHVINFTSQYNKSYTDKYSKFAESNAPAGILPFSLPGIKVKDIQGVSSNLGSTVTTLLAGLGAGALAIETGPVGMGLAAGSVGGATAYRMAVSDFSDSIKQMFDAESMKSNGRPMDQNEWDTIRTKYESDATKYGLWEAVPEALGTAVTLGVGKMVMSTAKNFLKSPLMKVTKSLAGLLGEVGTEVATETATQFGQSGVMSEAFGTPKQTLGQAYGEVVRPTVAMSVAGLPLGLGAGIAQNKLQQMIDKKLNIQQFTDIVPIEDGQPDNSVLFTWAMQNKEKADALVSKEKPSRADIEEAFGQKFRTTSEERNYISQALKGFDYKQASQELIEEEDLSAEEVTPTVTETSEQVTPTTGTEESVHVRNPEEDRKTQEYLVGKVESGEALTPVDIEDLKTLPQETATSIIQTERAIDDTVSYLEKKLVRGDDISEDDINMFNELPQPIKNKLVTVTEWAAEDLGVAEALGTIYEDEQTKEEPVETEQIQEEVPVEEETTTVEQSKEHMPKLKFKKDKDFFSNGEYTTTVNGIEYKVFKDGDIGGIQEWYFWRNTPEEYRKWSDYYFSGSSPRNSLLWTRKDVEREIIKDSLKDKEQPKPSTPEVKSYKSIADNIKNNKEFTETITIGKDQYTISAEIKEGNEVGFDYKINKRILPDKESFIKHVKAILKVEKTNREGFKEGTDKKKYIETKNKIRKNFLASVRTPSDVTTNKPKEKEESFKLFKAVIETVNKHAKKFGSARNKILKGVAGMYSARTKNIYVKSTNDVLTSAHEVAHYYDYKNEVFKDIIDYKTEEFIKKRNLFPIDSPYGRLMRLYIDEYGGFKDEKRKGHDPKLKLREGFSTLLERMIAEPDRMNKEYPDLVKWLKDKNLEGIDEYLKDFQDIIERYNNLSPIEKVEAKMYTKAQRNITNRYLNGLVDFGFLSKENAMKIQTLGQQGSIRQSFFNAISRIEDMERDILGTQTLSNTMHAFRYVNGIISSNIFDKGSYQILKGDGYYETLKFSVRDLFESVQSASKKYKLDMNKFSDLLIQRRVYGDWEKIDKLYKDMEGYFSDYGFNNVEEMIDLIDEVEPQTPNEKKEFKEVKKLVDKYKEMQSIVKKDGYTREDATNIYKEYSPLYQKELKMYDDIMKSRLDTMKEVGIISNEQYKEYKDDKFYTSFQRYFFQNHVDNIQKEAMKTTQSMIGSLKKRVGAYNPIYAPLEGMIDSEISYQKDCMRQLIYNKFIPIMNRMGIEKFENRKELNDDEYIVTKENGKDTSWRIGSEMKLMIHNVVHPAQPGLIARIFSGASRIKTIGTTAAYFPFAFVNPLIDQVSAYVNSQNDMIPLFSSINTMKSLYIEKNPENLQYANEYDRIAKNHQTIYGLYERDPEVRRNLILKETEGIRKYMQKSSDWIDRGFNILQMPVQFTETMTRKTEYIKARKNGKSIFNALEEAGSVSTPFHHMGSSTTVKTIVRSLPFFNASLQVLDMTNKAFFGKNPKTRKKAILAMSFLTSAMVLGVTSIMGFGSDEHKKLLLQKTPNELARNIFIPWYDGKLLSVRVPENMTMFAAMINMGFLEVFGNAKYTGAELVNGAMAWAPDQLNPFEFSQCVISWIPQLLKPAIEVIMDKKTFPSVQPLTPYAMQSMPKRLQRIQTTSWFANMAGSNILSPIQLDHLIEGYLGRASRFATGRWEIVMKNPFVSDWAYFTSGRVIQNYFSTYNKAKAEVSAIESGQINTKDLDTTYMKKLYSVKTIGDSVNKLMKIYRTIDKEKLKDEKSISLRNNILNLIDKFNEV